ncbi:DUF4440 domain-containing protein [Fictibacillus sp. S7]|uniref:DUF4440 domain-containing protein n=2 Tax=Fictibacillus TaxID=1329200 RepID=A0A0V8JBS7_9BACL|nr:DUF4440 domain-containing protein [Fictibacillus enclensis]KSU84404.1 hypothetical protein AS030_02280 [Fictibacillus enclensis]RXY99961.1 DUF4440 domain-containing protein [Fictibacillus sp. S7]SCB78834.1 hypothetical protein GA0061096_0488 [Fictibacillus enclensis]
MEKAMKEQMRELEESHLRPDVRTSFEKLDELLADDFMEFGSTGSPIRKEDCLTGDLDVDDFSLLNFEARLLAPDIVLTTYIIRNRTKDRNTLRSSLWKHMEGRWQLYFHQGTVTPLDPSDSAIHFKP